MIDFTANGNLKEWLDGMKLLRLTPALQRRYMSRVGRMVIAQARKNVRDQKTVSGEPMRQRKRMPPKERPVYHSDGSKTMKKTHGEMFFDLAKSRFLGMKLISSSSAKVHFFRNAGTVAYRHHHGKLEKFVRKPLEELFTPEEMDDFSPESFEYVSREVANELIRTGIKQPRDKIMKDWMNYQAVIHFRNMKREWTVTTPKRPFLGASEEQIRNWGDLILRDLHGKFRAKSYAGNLK